MAILNGVGRAYRAVTAREEAVEPADLDAVSDPHDEERAFARLEP